MAKQHRYTGEWPPVDVVRRFPNWDFALDEEDEAEQDETTIRPEEEQTYVTEWTGYTAADVTLASGERFTGLVEVIGRRIHGVDVLDPEGCWRVRRDADAGTWSSHVEDWRPVEERMRSVPLSAVRAFPLRLSTLLPFDPTGAPVVMLIQPDGSEVKNPEI